MRFNLPIVELELEGLEILAGISEEKIKESLRAGLVMMSQHVQQVWMAIAQREGLHEKGAYISGIFAEDSVSIEIDDTGEGLFRADLTVTNRNPKALVVEEGHGPFHLPDVIDWSNTKGSIKLGKKGPYLQIPFRHTAYAGQSERDEKGYLSGSLRRMMPQDVSLQANALRRRIPNREGPIRNEKTGRLIQQDTYRWESRNKGADKRLSRGNDGPRFIFGAPGGEQGHEEWRSARIIGRAKGGTSIVNPAWKSSKYEGLFKAGPSRHTSYMTVRTITPNSEGWWIPAMRGRWILPKVVTVLEQAGQLDKLFSAAVAGSLGVAVEQEG